MSFLQHGREAELAIPLAVVGRLEIAGLAGLAGIAGRFYDHDDLLYGGLRWTPNLWHVERIERTTPNEWKKAADAAEAGEYVRILRDGAGKKSHVQLLPRGYGAAIEVAAAFDLPVDLAAVDRALSLCRWAEPMQAYHERRVAAACESVTVALEKARSADAPAT